MKVTIKYTSNDTNDSGIVDYDIPEGAGMGYVFDHWTDYASTHNIDIDATDVELVEQY